MSTSGQFPNEDLQVLSSALSGMLLSLLMSRNSEALVRWCKVRTWIDNAIDGEPTPDMLSLELAVQYLAQEAKG